MTQIEAANALGMSREMIGNYEAGRRREGRDVVGRDVVIPLHVELACAALAAGITAYTEPAG